MAAYSLLVQAAMEALQEKSRQQAGVQKALDPLGNE